MEGAVPALVTKYRRQRRQSAQRPEERLRAPWGAFFQIILPIALPGMVAAFILSLVLTWNEYFFAALLTSTHANTLPVMVASQTGSQGINWWSMGALSLAAILPLIIIGVLLER
jgi:multiple sugar transport system permease protein